MRQLPESARGNLACAGSESLEVLSDTALKIHEVYARPVAAEVSRDTQQEVDDPK